MELEAAIQIQINLKINLANPENLQALQEFITKINTINQQQQHQQATQSIERQIRETTANFNPVPAIVQAPAPAPAPALVPVIDTNPENDPLTCNKCGRVFTSVRRFENHKNAVTCKPRMKQILQLGVLKKCTGCGLEAKSKQDLEQFVSNRVLTHGRMNLCKECRKKQLKKYGDSKPKKPPHELVGKGHTCPRCGSSRLYGNGYRSDTHDRCFVCRDCGRSFTDKTNKEKNHKPIPPDVKCKYCGGRNLRRKGVYDGKQNYECLDCNRNFRWPIGKAGKTPSLSQAPVEKKQEKASLKIKEGRPPERGETECPDCHGYFKIIGDHYRYCKKLLERLADEGKTIDEFLAERKQKQAAAFEAARPHAPEPPQLTPDQYWDFRGPPPLGKLWCRCGMPVENPEDHETTPQHRHKVAVNGITELPPCQRLGIVKKPLPVTKDTRDQEGDPEQEEDEEVITENPMKEVDLDNIPFPENPARPIGERRTRNCSECGDVFLPKTDETKCEECTIETYPSVV